MNAATSSRLELARKASAVYAQQSSVVAVVVAGSVGRLRADDYSDVELDVYWRVPPSDEERRTSIVALGASWYMRHVLLARQDWLMLAELLVHMQQRMMGALLALNRVYLAHPRFKWLGATIEELKLAPVALAERLKQLHAGPYASSVEIMHGLLSDTINLAERELPDLDWSGAQRAIRRVREPASKDGAW